MSQQNAKFLWYARRHAPTRGGLWQTRLPALAAIAAAALCIGLGARFIGAAGGAPAWSSDVLVLMALTVWLGFSAAPLAAGAESLSSALLRAAILADAGGLVLVVLVASRGIVDWWVALRAYILWAGMALAAAGFVHLARTSLGRAILATVLVFFTFLACATPIWSNSLILSFHGPWQLRLCQVISCPNPLLAIASTLPASQFVWTEQSILYSITRMGQDYGPPQLGWQAAAIFWWIFAGAVWFAALFTRAWRSFWYGT